MLVWVFFLIAGFIVGSFLGMLTYRHPRGLSLSGRSKCVMCHKTIAWYYNIPLFSYLFLRGRCRYCKKSISLRYPLLEFLSGLLFVLTYYLWYTGLGEVGRWTGFLGIYVLLFLLILVLLFLVLGIIDFEFQILPDLYVVLLSLSVWIWIFFVPLDFSNHLLSGLVSAGFFLFLFLVTRGRGMGFGDVKLAFPLGSLLGLPLTIVFIMTAFILGALVGTVMLLTKRARLGREIAFGPYLLIGAYVAMFFGDWIIQWYLGYGN